jgi:hypothetical protein
MNPFFFWSEKQLDRGLGSYKAYKGLTPTAQAVVKERHNCYDYQLIK